jgi:FMN phosphatase YigB (HAD superfamily)
MPELDPDRIATLTFDCYSTLIDWEAGKIEALRPLLAQNGVTLSDDEIIYLLLGPRRAPNMRHFRARSALRFCANS